MWESPNYLDASAAGSSSLIFGRHGHGIWFMGSSIIGVRFPLVSATAHRPWKLVLKPGLALRKALSTAMASVRWAAAIRRSR